jgi:glycosyltransferase involved in cell wall biosynthesis
MIQSNKYPLVSVILPIRNEADFIEQCISSILKSDYPEESMEIIVIDGMSNDGTRQIVKDLSEKDSRILLFDNPRFIVPFAMNQGIRQSRGEIIIRIDGHVKIDPDFISKSVSALKEHPEAWCTGGPVETVNSTYTGNAISAAMSSPVGVGNAMFRLGNFEGYVDTLAFGAYWRWVFDKIGFFDEELVRNQDDELNMRLILNGGKIFMTPAIHSLYFARSSLGKLARQYYQYGFWRIRTIQKHKRPATLRQIIPLAFVSLWIVLGIAAFFTITGKVMLGGFSVFYSSVLIFGLLDVARKKEWRSALLSPIIFIILHFSYGIGSLYGIVWWVILGKKPSFNHSASKLSR